MQRLIFSFLVSLGTMCHQRAQQVQGHCFEIAGIRTMMTSWWLGAAGLSADPAGCCLSPRFPEALGALVGSRCRPFPLLLARAQQNGCFPHRPRASPQPPMGTLRRYLSPDSSADQCQGPGVRGSACLWTRDLGSAHGVLYLQMLRSQVRRAVRCQMGISGWDFPISHLVLTAFFLSPEILWRRDSGACSRARRSV